MGGGDGGGLMGGIFLVFKEFFLEGFGPPHKISVYTPLVCINFTVARFDR